MHDSMTLTELNELQQWLLANESIPCTLEHPGYILIKYRNIDINIGEECGEMQVQIDRDGESIGAYTFDCRNMAVHGMVTIIKNYLVVCYLKIDILLKSEGR